MENFEIFKLFKKPYIKGSFPQGLSLLNNYFSSSITFNMDKAFLVNLLKTVEFQKEKIAFWVETYRNFKNYLVNDYFFSNGDVQLNEKKATLVKVIKDVYRDEEYIKAFLILKEFFFSHEVNDSYSKNDEHYYTIGILNKTPLPVVYFWEYTTPIKSKADFPFLFNQKKLKFFFWEDKKENHPVFIIYEFPMLNPLLNEGISELLHEIEGNFQKKENSTETFLISSDAKGNLTVDNFSYDFLKKVNHLFFTENEFSISYLKSERFFVLGKHIKGILNLYAKANQKEQPEDLNVYFVIDTHELQTSKYESIVYKIFKEFVFAFFEENDFSDLIWNKSEVENSPKVNVYLIFLAYLPFYYQSENLKTPYPENYSDKPYLIPDIEWKQMKLFIKPFENERDYLKVFKTPVEQKVLNAVNKVIFFFKEIEIESKKVNLRENEPVKKGNNSEILFGTTQKIINFFTRTIKRKNLYPKREKGLSIDYKVSFPEFYNLVYFNVKDFVPFIVKFTFQKVYK